MVVKDTAADGESNELNACFLVKRRAAGHLSHCVQQVRACRCAWSQRLQRKGSGKVRRTTLEADFQKVAIVSSAQGRHGAGNFFLTFRLRGNHYRGQAFKLPSCVFNCSFRAAAREPAEILHLQTECWGRIQVSLEGDYFLRVADFLDQPMCWSFLRSHLHQHPRAPKNAAGEPQGNTKARSPHPCDTYHMTASGQRCLNPAQDFPGFGTLVPQ